MKTSRHLRTATAGHIFIDIGLTSILVFVNGTCMEVASMEEIASIQLKTAKKHASKLILVRYHSILESVPTTAQNTSLIGQVKLVKSSAMVAVLATKTTLKTNRTAHRNAACVSLFKIERQQTMSETQFCC